MSTIYPKYTKGMTVYLGGNPMETNRKYQIPITESVITDIVFDKNDFISYHLDGNSTYTAEDRLFPSVEDLRRDVADRIKGRAAMLMTQLEEAVAEAEKKGYTV